MTAVDHRQVMGGFADVISRHDWDNLARWVHPDAVWEYPQSGERFRGIANIRAQFENYPGLGRARLSWTRSSAAPLTR